MSPLLNQASARKKHIVKVNRSVVFLCSVNIKHTLVEQSEEVWLTYCIVSSQYALW